MSRAAPPVKAPTDRLAIAMMVLAAAMVPVALTMSAVFVPLLAAFAAVFGAFGWRQLALGRSAVRTHAALQAITRGQMDEAEAHLAAIPRWFMRKGSVMRSALYQRGLIAFYRGDARGAAALLDPATDRRTHFATKNYEGMQRMLVLSLRALAHASAGDAERAKGDSAEVAASELATPEALARARLAEAVVLARAGEMDALAALFRTHGSLVLEHTFPRERVLARALRKMVQARARSVYREAARPEEESAATGTIGEWIAQIAPDAAAHATDAARLAERAEMTAAPATDEAAMRAVKDARERAAKGERKPRVIGRPAFTLALWAVVIGLFVAIYDLLPATPSGGAGDHVRRAAHAPPPISPTDFVTYSAGGVFALFVAVLAVTIVSQTRKLRKAERQIIAAQRAMALGDRGRAEPLLVALEKDRVALGPANALFLRAKHAEEAARFEECVAFCDRALGSIAAQVHANRVVASMALTPAIVGLRGVALAALGRSAEATAELATIAREHATWSHRATAELRIRLMLAAKSGDLEAARAVARSRTPEMPISIRDEALADLLLATAPSGASRDEQERVDGELREDMAVRSWIGAVAPELRDDLARRVSGKNLRIGVQDPAEIQAGEMEDEEEVEQAAFRRP